MKHIHNNLFIVLGIFVITSCVAACQEKENNSAMRKLQQSILKYSNVADKVDADMESLWAYNSADSIVKTMELKKESVWRDLARAYTALSYIGYGMSYTRAVRSGDINKLYESIKVVVKCNPDTIEPNKYLHLMELKSDSSFIFFYDISHMERTEDMKTKFQESVSLWDSIYSDESMTNGMKQKGISENFMAFQRENKDFFFIYSSMLVDLISINGKSEEELQKKSTDWLNIAYEMDSLPSKWEELLPKQIALRAKLINMLTNEIQALE